MDKENVLMWEYELTKSAVKWDENVLWAHIIHVGGGNVIHTHTNAVEYYLALKKEGNSDISYNTDAKLNKPITKGQMLYDFIHTGVWSSRIYRDRRSTMVASTEGEGKWGVRVS